MDPPNSGQRRAALRVKQKMRNDQQRWTPSGKLTRRPPSRPNRIPRRKPSKPWNDRFIFDEESLARHGDEDFVPIKANGGRKQHGLGSTLSAQRIVNGKENNANDFLVGETNSRKW